MKKILVTGSRGYIGKHLMHLLTMYPDYHVHELDLVTGQDIRNEKSMESHFEKYDAVIHLAALVRMNESVKEPLKYCETNIVGTMNVLRHIKHDNFIFASTGAAQEPNNPYAYSKRVAEDSGRHG